MFCFALCHDFTHSEIIEEYIYSPCNFLNIEWFAVVCDGMNALFPRKPTFLSTSFWKIVLEKFVLGPGMSKNTCFSTFTLCVCLQTKARAVWANEIFSVRIWKTHEPVEQSPTICNARGILNVTSKAANSDLRFTRSVHSFLKSDVDLSHLAPWIGKGEWVRSRLQAQNHRTPPEPSPAASAPHTIDSRGLTDVPLWP